MFVAHHSILDGKSYYKKLIAEIGFARIENIQTTNVWSTKTGFFLEKLIKYFMHAQLLITLVA